MDFEIRSERRDLRIFPMTSPKKLCTHGLRNEGDLRRNMEHAYQTDGIDILHLSSLWEWILSINYTLFGLLNHKVNKEFLSDPSPSNARYYGIL